MQIEENYNPDVLTCLANLSNDEVFTPPSLVNQILDLLPPELWKDKNATFLDPACKSGVFLREIAKRLIEGLSKEIPDLQKRLDHIYTKQLFGIAITELTALLSRRSLYCSKLANGKYSVCSGFDQPNGNIYFERTEHTWNRGRCSFCGANESEYERGEELETHAYKFIHTDNPEEIFNMKFDVIIGNPPYQMSDGGFGASAKPIYQKFVQQAIKLKPRYLSMIIPSRYFVGGRVGELSEFRDQMLQDRRLRILHDFADAGDCFPGVEIKGGVNFFLWDRDNQGKCKVFTHQGSEIVSTSERDLLEPGSTTFIRCNEAIPILRKVQKMGEESFSSIVSANDPFGFDVRQENSMKRVKPNYKTTAGPDTVAFYYNGWKKSGLGYIDRNSVKKNLSWLNKNKLFVPKAIGVGNSKSDIVKPLVPVSDSCCSETYIVIGPFSSKKHLENARSYIGTRFFHFLLSLRKITQEARRGVYSFIPLQDFSEEWSDEKLFQKYALTKKEVAFIEAMTPSLEALKCGGDDD